MALRGLRIVTQQLKSTLRVVPAFAHGSRSSMPALSFSKHFCEAAAEDDIVKDIFVQQQTQFRAFLKELEDVDIPLDPNDDEAVKEYAEACKEINKKIGATSMLENFGDLIQSAFEDSDDLREYIGKARSVRKEFGLEDDVLEYEQIMFDAMDSVEKKLGKPLALDDESGMEMWREEVEAANSKLGLKEADMESVEEKIEIELAREEIAAFQEEAKETIQAYKKRDGLEAIDVDIKSLNPKAYI